MSSLVSSELLLFLSVRVIFIFPLTVLFLNSPKHLLPGDIVGGVLRRPDVARVQ